MNNDEGGTKPVSYASVLNEEPNKKKVNLRLLTTNETVINADLAVPLASV